MAGTASVSLNKIIKSGKKIYEIVCDWQSTQADGSATSIALGSTLYDQNRIDNAIFSGKILSILTSPGVDGNRITSLPTNLYDITLKDQWGYDVLDGNGMNRSSCVAETVVFADPLFVNSDLTAAISNAGTPSYGKFKVYIDPSGA